MATINNNLSNVIWQSAPTTNPGHKVWYGPPPLTTGGSHTHTIVNGAYTNKARRFKQDRITKKLSSYEFSTRINDYFYRADVDNLISVFGNEKPLYRRRPKKWLQSLLLMGNFNRLNFNRQLLFTRGLVYIRPAIMGRRATHYRLTPAALELIDHIVKRHPNFKPFVDAYISKENRAEIISDCTTFALDILPNDYTVAIQKNEELMQKEAMRQAALNQYAQQYNRQAFPSATPSFSPYSGTTITSQTTSQSHIQSLMLRQNALTGIMNQKGLLSSVTSSHTEEDEGDVWALAK